MELENIICDILTQLIIQLNTIGILYTMYIAAVVNVHTDAATHESKKIKAKKKLNIHYICNNCNLKRNLYTNPKYAKKKRTKKK